MNMYRIVEQNHGHFSTYSIRKNGFTTVYYANSIDEAQRWIDMQYWIESNQESQGQQNNQIYYSGGSGGCFTIGTIFFLIIILMSFIGKKDEKSNSPTPKPAMESTQSFSKGEMK